MSNMAYVVPQFIERETRIAGPLTFKQLTFVVTAAGISVLLYFLKLPLFLVIISAIILMGSGLALAFWRIEGFPLPTVIKNFFVFLSRSKLYLWKKKVIPPKIAQKKELPKKEIKESSVLKIAERSKIRELLTFLETRSR